MAVQSDADNTPDKGSLDIVADRLYAEVKALAKDAMRHEAPWHTLQPTALANEVFIKLSSSRQRWDSDAAFIAAVVVSIRRILVDHARIRGAAKRPHRNRRVQVDLDEMVASPDTLLEMDELMTRLKARNPTIAQVIELQVFAGLNAREIGQIVGLNEKTVRSYRDTGRAWLRSQIWDVDGDEDNG